MSHLEHWKKTTLGDSCDFFNGKAHEQGIDNDGKFIVVNSKFISSEGSIYKKTNSALFPLFKDDIAMVMSDVPHGRALAKCYFVEHDQKYSLNQRICVIRSDNFYPRFLFYYLNRNQYFLRFDNGNSQTNLRKNDILKCPLYKPPLEEQKRIAAILDKADAIRRKRKKAIALTEELLRSTFLDMFGDPVTNPKGWKVEALDNFALIQSGIAKGKKVNPSEAVSMPYIRVANVQDGYLNLDEIKELQITPKDIDRYLLQNGDLLLTEGGDPDKLGRGAIWYSPVDPCLHQNHIFAVRPRKEIAEPEYLSALIGSNYGKRYFLRAAKQTTGIATINKTQLKRFPALLPPIDLQKKYTKTVQSLKATKKNYLNTQNCSENLFNSLLQKAFRGEL